LSLLSLLACFIDLDYNSLIRKLITFLHVLGFG